MAMGGAEGIGTSFYGHQIFLFQFSLKIIDENQRWMLSDLRKLNFSPKPILFVKFWIISDFNEAKIRVAEYSTILFWQGQFFSRVRPTKFKANIIAKIERY